MRNGFSLNKGNPSVKFCKTLKAKGKSLRRKIKTGRSKLKAMATSKNPHTEGSSACVKDLTKVISQNAMADKEGCDEMNDEDNATLLFEGDCFYEAEESLIEHSDEESVDEESVDEELPKDNSCDKFQDDWVPFDEVPFDEPPRDGAKTKETTVEDKGTGDSAIFLEETPLPRMFIPGKIIHIYTHRGGYKAATVPRAFRELRRISLAGNMINDHMAKSYYEALLECKSVRKAEKDLPVWTSFAEEMTW